MLKKRQIEILQLAAEGLTTTEMAERLDLAVGTVRSHRVKVLAELDAQTMTQAVVRAILRGDIDLDERWK